MKTLLFRVRGSIVIGDVVRSSSVTDVMTIDEIVKVFNIERENVKIGYKWEEKQEFNFKHVFQIDNVK